PKHFPEISWKPLNLAYIQGIALLGILMTSYGDLSAAAGEGLRQVILILQRTVSLAAIVILLRRVMDRKAGRLERAFLWTIIALRVVVGISSGWLGAATSLAMVCALVYLQKRHKLPIAALACLLPYVLFF